MQSKKSGQVENARTLHPIQSHLAHYGMTVNLPQKCFGLISWRHQKQKELLSFNYSVSLKHSSLVLWSNVTRGGGSTCGSAPSH